MRRCKLGFRLLPIAVAITAMVGPARSQILIDEHFDTDVIGSGSWYGVNASVAVDVDSGWLRIGADGAVNGYAGKDSTCPLPLQIEWRMRTFNGEGAVISLPKLEFWWGPDAGDSYHITYTTADSWLLGIWTGVDTLGPLAWGEWRTLRAVIRTDGGDLYAKQDCDPNFPQVASVNWSIPSEIERIRLSQHTDDVSELDFIRVTALGICHDRLGDYNCDGYEDAVDLALLIDRVFFGGNPATPCTVDPLGP